MPDRDGDFTTYVVQRRPQLYRLAYLLCLAHPFWQDLPASQSVSIG